MNLDMNDENNNNDPVQDVKIETLLQIIGLRDVENYVQGQNVNNHDCQLKEMIKQFQINIDNLKKINLADDERIKQLEQKLHEVAIERDNISKINEGYKMNISSLSRSLDTERDTSSKIKKEFDDFKIQINKKSNKK